MRKYTFNTKNRRPFSEICGNRFGRDIIITRKQRIDETNIVGELNHALSIHGRNAIAIDYLDRYYRGDQPILYREKKVRPEVNNKVVENLALFIVETKVSEMAGEPIQYVLHGTDEDKSKQVADLNAIMDGEDKAFFDIELCRWRSICGTGYRYIGNDTVHTRLLDEANFYLSTEDPRYTFVAYHTDGQPAFSCQIREDEEGKTFYHCFTPSHFYVVKGGEIVDRGLNGNGAIPVIEYPNNMRRMSDIEITITITDDINTIASDRANGIEQFVQSWIKFVNCEIDEEQFRKMRAEGALVVRSTSGSENRKADVDVMSNELNQTQTQVAINDQFEKLLVIQGIADRQSNTGGDTQGAVTLRNGFYSMEKRSEIAEPIFIRSERQALRIILNRLRITNQFDLVPSDVEIKISRTKSDNMQVKAQVLQMLLASGIRYERAIKTVGLFSDPEQVAIESSKRMDILYPETVQQEAAAAAAVPVTNVSEEIIETTNGSAFV